MHSGKRPAHIHYSSRISIPLFSLLPFTAWGANECSRDQWRGNKGSPQLWFPLWFIKFPIVSIEEVQCSFLGKLWQHCFYTCDRYMRRELEVRQIQRKRQKCWGRQGIQCRRRQGIQRWMESGWERKIEPKKCQEEMGKQWMSRMLKEEESR